MNATVEKIRGNWNQIKGQLKEKYGELTDDDLKYEEGKEEELLGRIQEKTGEVKQDIKRWIDNI